MDWFPATVALELSSACTLACPFCDRTNWGAFGGKRATSFMDLRLFRLVVDELKEFAPSTAITLSYEGESLLHPQFADALTYLKAKGFRPWISTTLLGADETAIEALLDCCSTISVSLLAPESEFVDMGGSLAAHRQSRANIEKLLRIRRQRGSAAQVSVSTILRKNDSLESERTLHFIDQWRSLVDELQIWFEVEYGNGIRYSHRSGLKRHLKWRRVCLQPFTYLAILSDGSISPCCVTSRVRFNSLRAEMGLQSVISSYEYRNFQAAHRDRKLDGTPCSNCELWLDDWLGDEVLTIGKNAHRLLVEGYTARIPGDGKAMEA
jgi:radical SAM protein with 4Fe4S-binding SPASM domain